MRIACPLGHRTFEKPKETSFAPCWPKVNWLTFGRTGRKLRKHQAKFVFVFGKYLSLQRGGRLSTLKLASQMFVVSGPGPATAKDASQADIQCHACRHIGPEDQAGRQDRQGAEMALLLRHPADRL